MPLMAAVVETGRSPLRGLRPAVILFFLKNSFGFIMYGNTSMLSSSEAIFRFAPDHLLGLLLK